MLLQVMPIYLCNLRKRPFHAGLRGVPMKRFAALWSDDSTAFSNDIIDDEIKNNAWNFIDFCNYCGSCNGGKNKIIFGKEFDGVCGCTFRVDNPQRSDLPFLKKMVELCKLYISKNDIIKHYDLLIDENYDPVHNPKPLRDYMDRWDGRVFIDKMKLDKKTSVLEISQSTPMSVYSAKIFCLMSFQSFLMLSILL